MKPNAFRRVGIVALLTFLSFLSFNVAARADTTDDQVNFVQAHFHFKDPANPANDIDHNKLRAILTQSAGQTTYLDIGTHLASLMDQKVNYDTNHFFEGDYQFFIDVGQFYGGVTNWKDAVLTYAVEYLKAKGFVYSAGVLTAVIAYQTTLALVVDFGKAYSATAINELTRDYIASVPDPDNDAQDWTDLLFDVRSAPIQKFMNDNGYPNFSVHDFCRDAWKTNRSLSSLPAETALFTTDVNSLITGVVNITYDPASSFTAPTTLSFNASSSTGTYGSNIVSYKWSIDTTAAGTAASISQTFWQPGSHTIYVTLTDGAGNSLTGSIPVIIYPPYINIVSADRATLLATVSTSSNPLVTQYTWDFGDKTTPVTGASLTQPPAHHYPTQGSYAVKLTEKTQNGNTITASNVVTLQPPTTYTWTGASTSSQGWFDSSNWAPSGVPGSIDTAIINGGSVYSSDNITIANLTLNGNLSGGAQITATGTSNWTNGTLACTLNIPTGGVLNISGDAAGGLGNKGINGGVLNNAGTTTWTGKNTIYFGADGYGNNANSGGTINNSGTFLVQNDGTVYAFNPTGCAFNNSGTLTKNTATGTTPFYNTPFNNSGIVNGNSGTLSFGGGSSTGTFNTSGSGAIGLNSITLNTGTAINGTGCSSGSSGFLNGAVTINGTFTINSSFTGKATGSFNGAGIVNIVDGAQLVGTINLPAGNPNVPTVNWIGGQITGTLNIPTGGVLNISGDAAGGLGNKGINGGVLNNAGTTTWTGKNTIYFGADGYGNNANSGGTINNSGTFLVQNDGTVYAFNPTGCAFNNSGTLTKNTATGTTPFYNTPFNNSGIVNGNSGTLSFGGGSSTGTFNTSGSGAIGLNSITLNTGTAINGTGCSSGSSGFLNGAVTINGTFTINSSFTGKATGSFNGAGIVNIVDGAQLVGTINLPAGNPNVPTVNWIGGQITGTLNIPTGGVLNISGDAAGGLGNKGINGGVLNNAGTTTWTGKNTIYFGADGYGNNANSGGTINNSGTFLVQNDGTVYAFNPTGCAFNNSGTLTKNTATGTTPFYNTPFNNSGIVNGNSGTLNFSNLTQTAGSTNLNGGSLGGTLTIQGGALSGSGTISGNVTNSGGAVYPGGAGTAGILAINGNYTQGAGGSLNIDVGGSAPGTQYDQLQVTGVAALDGTLNTRLISNFVPAVGSTFMVMPYTSYTGGFARVISQNPSVARKLTPQYLSSGMLLGAKLFSPFDFNGSGLPDLVLTNSTAQQVALWFTNGPNITGGAYALSGPNPIPLPSTWHVVGVGDFNNDGQPDLVLMNTSTGQIAFWFTNGASVIAGAYATSNGSQITVPPNWQIVGVGDFNGDGQPDLVLQNTGSQIVVIWYMNGTNITSGAYVTIGGGNINLPPGWQIVGVGDFNGDGQPDLALDNINTGQIAFWFTAGPTVTGGVYATSNGAGINVPAGWQIAAVGDYNLDGKPDLVLQNLSAGRLVFWYMNGTSVTSGAYALTGTQPVTLPSGWQVAGPR